jgi:hypothetical protein
MRVAHFMFERLILHQGSRVTQGCVDVIGIEKGIMHEDRFSSFTRGQQAQQAGHGEAMPADAGFAGADGGIDGNTVELHVGAYPILYANEPLLIDRSLSAL